jgi:hypothetical protein
MPTEIVVIGTTILWMQVLKQSAVLQHNHGLSMLTCVEFIIGGWHGAGMPTPYAGTGRCIEISSSMSQQILASTLVELLVPQSNIVHRIEGCSLHRTLQCAEAAVGLCKYL